MPLNTFLIAALVILAGIGPTLAQTSDASIRKAVDDFLRIQIKGLPGKASYTIDTIQSNSLPPCSAFDVSPTAGAQAMGRSSVTVRCLAGANWSLLVPVKIHVLGNYLVSARSITPGQTIGPNDVVSQTGDLGELPGGILSAPEQAIGQVARSGLPAGRPLRADMLKAQTVIQSGQSVKVVSNGPGFQVANEGKAMGAAVIGQVVQIRLSSGQVVSGIARASGNVEINF
jgi:flagella basal body P-ring formation protein FlgA